MNVRRRPGRSARTGRGRKPWRVDAAGWLDAARHVSSPNFDERPDAAEPTLLVVHNISLPPGEFGGSGVIDLFLNRLDRDAHPYYRDIADLRVSSHFLVRRDGELIQFVSCAMRAWHAGQSQWHGRTRCNDFSLGVELEGTDDLPYTDRQYDTLAALAQALCAHYPLSAIAGHADIATPPGRKTDPGPAFDWNRVEALLEAGGLRLARAGARPA